MDRPGWIRLVGLLTVGMLCISCGSIFVRLAAAPALAVAVYRVAWATLLLAPMALAGQAREWSPLSRREWGFLLLSGAALALHFALWIASLSYTSVASSVLLVNTTPFFIGLASHWLLGRPCRIQFWIGLGAAFVGCVVIFRGDLSLSASSLEGNLLALGGAVAMALYFLVGARARRRLSLLAYVWPVYGAAALALAIVCLLSGTPMRGFTLSAHLYMFLLGLIPQCIGHTTYNWSLRWLPPALVGIVSLSEPVGASLLAYLFLNEGITAAKLAGGGIVLLGIYIATRAGQKKASR